MKRFGPIREEPRAARILLVDDDADLIELLTPMLIHEGHQVTAASSRQEAEQVLMTLQPDLAIVDLIMEEHDAGFVLSHQIKRLYPGTPVVLLTTAKSAAGISFAAASREQQSWIEADRVLDKPVRPEQIQLEVRRLLVEASNAEPVG